MACAGCGKKGKLKIEQTKSGSSQPSAKSRSQTPLRVGKKSLVVNVTSQNTIDKHRA